MKKSILTLTALLVFPTLTLAATPEPGTFTLSPQIGGYVFEGNQDLDNGVMFGIAPGYFFSRELAVEAVVQYVDTETDFSANNEDIDGWLYHVDVLYHFSPDKKLVPFIAAGLGGISLDDMPGERNTSLQMNYGAGLKYALSDNLDLRGDIRHMVSFNDNYNSLAALVGLTYNFGGTATPAAPMPVAAPAPIIEKDSDRDGVMDNIDRCPTTPAGVMVDEKGCAIKDSDHDGVMDNIDRCPTTPAGVMVDEKGCAIKDSDYDGVNDRLDRCPTTPEGVMVDENGCALTEELSVNLHIEFDTNKADIKPTYHSHCQEVADFLKASPQATAVIEGHTDNVGDATYNQNLSQKRATAVRQYLIDQFSIEPERLEAKGFGETTPLTTNDTAAGRQDNRRVVATFTIVKNKTK